MINDEVSLVELGFLKPVKEIVGYSPAGIISGTLIVMI